MNPVSFTRKEPNAAHPDGKEVGFIAEEVQKVEPRLVEYEPDGVTPRGVLYMNYTAYLTQAIKEMNVREHWQWAVIGFLALMILWQQRQIARLRKP